MLLGILSDTHGHQKNTLAAANVFRKYRVDLVIHCGDIGSASIPPLLQDWPTHYVFGNVDREVKKLRTAIQDAQQTCHNAFGSLELGERKIAFLHSHDVQRFQDTITSGEWDLVCYGHTHKAESRRVGRTLVLNPGAVFRSTPHSVAVVSLPELKAEIVPF